MIKVYNIYHTSTSSMQFEINLNKILRCFYLLYVKLFKNLPLLSAGRSYHLT